MGWVDYLNPRIVLPVLAVAVLGVSGGLIAVAIVLRRADSSRVRRFVEAQDGTLLSIERVNGLGLWVNMQQEFDPDIPRFKVHWLDRHGRERVNTFLTQSLDNAVWTAQPTPGETDLTPGLTSENKRRVERVERRREKAIVIGAVLFVVLVVIGDLVYTLDTGRAPSVGEVLSAVGLVVIVIFMAWLRPG